MRTRRIGVLIAFALGLAIFAVLRDEFAPKRRAVVEPGKIVRGAWPRPAPLLHLIRQDGIRTVVTLTAINRDDPKYVAHERAVRQTGADWRIIPMRGSTATLDQMAEAADLIADPALQPVFFHCVGGHHRSNLVHAAYLIRHKGLSAGEAWRTVSALPWSRPDRDEDDRARIFAFAERQRAREGRGVR